MSHNQTPAGPAPPAETPAGNGKTPATGAQTKDQKLDEGLDESFPASDPPSISGSTSAEGE
ncbi:MULTISPECIES: hypothetical protein [Nguyenibacter]|uniref:Uncharacterized protein n=1 Tax=Nguyenibacter vanlangensis TaxID=1216886 RepID=A0ABZ3D4J3_9PROT|nr:hypothetical protein [Nguyenibacter sp. L1]WRH87421.1 hypothetical protein QN315_15815 [Nguyenibacter sp. L1]